MTMFAKGTWTVCNITTEEDAFRDRMAEVGHTYMPLLARSSALRSQGHALAIAPFANPRIGDVDEIMFKGKADPVRVEDILSSFAAREWVYDPTACTFTDPTATIDLHENELWTNDPEAWLISEGVYAFWFIDFDWDDVHDINSKKEAVAYEYGAPFKFQPSDLKKQITEQVAKMDTITRKQFQVIVDFNLKRAWMNSAKKPVMEELLSLMVNLGAPLSDWRPENDNNMEPQWTETFLRKLVDATDYQDEFTERAAQIKMHGVQGVEPNESAHLEKILKAYFSFSPMDVASPDDFLALSGPLAVRLAPTVSSTIALRTPYEATEMLNDDHQELLLTSAPMTFCRLVEKASETGVKTMLFKEFSIDVTTSTLTPDVPGFVVKGLALDNFRNTVKELIRARGTDTISIKDYWQLWYYGMNQALFRYLGLVKETMES